MARIKQRSVEAEPSGAGRPKGRNFVTISISVTSEQALWLSQERNASEIIRELLQSKITAETLNPDYVKSVELRKKLERLNKTLYNLRVEEQGLINEGNEHRFEGHEEGEGERQRYRLDRNEQGEPVPKYEEDSEAHAVLLTKKIISKQIWSIEKQIKSATEELVKLGEASEGTT
jgi:hypothetical protein